ncbi:thymidylate synthase [uncultured Methylophaga sp.]|uniref:thymidylate synthase n=1 Tax=uncultured Methylophaga sp. TaxID=285271 RepID=UPI002615D1F2|nr:thymidylate synthase [uncultured Methylophaga sp.]
MEIQESTLDDLLNEVYRKLLQEGVEVEASKGKNIELNSVLLVLSNPLARLSRTETRSLLFSCLGELLWYLSGSNEVSFIEHYLPSYGELASDDGVTVHGAYGPRLTNAKGCINQIYNIIELLRTKPSSRRAVIQLFDASDLASYHKDIPCTCTLQFLIRNKKLNLITYMRSNDAYIGLPHDIFSFTMLQEIVARALNVDLGVYRHFVGSLHLYDEKINKAQQLLEEGYQSTLIQMPEMPMQDVWDSIYWLIKIEEQCRNGNDIRHEVRESHPYWSDLARLLLVYANKKSKPYIEAITKDIEHDVYQVYVRKFQK